MLTGPRIIAGRRPLEIVRLIGVSALQGPSYASGLAALDLDGAAGARVAKRTAGAADLAMVAAGGARRARRVGAAVSLALSQVGAGRRVARVAGSAGLSLSGSAEVLSLDTSAVALIARMSPAPSSARKVLINTLVRALKSGGLWTKLDALYLTAAHDAQAARLNWVSPSDDLTAVNSPAFTVDLGYSGNGTTSYLDTNADPSVDFTRMTLNSATYGGWVSSETTSNNNVMGQSTSTATITPRNSANGATVRVHDGTSLSVTGITTSIGLTATNRSGSARNIYRNGAALAADTRAATAMPTELWLLRNAGSYYPGRISAAFAGASLTDAEHLALYSALRAYMTGVGVA